LEIMVLMALAHASGEDLPEARRLLMDALALAQPEGYQRLFLDEGPPMARLLRAVEPEIRSEPLGSYLRALLHAFTPDQAARGGEEERGRRGAIGAPAPSLSHSPPLPLPQELVEPLSPQEQRVLRLLAAGLSNPEIADELVVSVNTIKTQLQSIYRKLNVSSRAEARRAARQLDLL
jgi:LuxR family maltose regulon positive regulatory protein